MTGKPEAQLSRHTQTHSCCAGSLLVSITGQGHAHCAAGDAGSKGARKARSPDWAHTTPMVLMHLLKLWLLCLQCSMPHAAPGMQQYRAGGKQARVLQLLKKSQHKCSHHSLAAPSWLMSSNSVSSPMCLLLCLFLSSVQAADKKCWPMCKVGRACGGLGFAVLAEATALPPAKH